MSYKVTVCITETLERLVEVDGIGCDAVEYVRRQYLDEEIVLDSSDLIHTEFQIMT
ncbi:DpnD/PcfM family protein [Turicibacter sanguinis]|uniref:DpnD/PcfM family protein n=1 Tax=Turicibacter sanguinis TaxID=154288 RepID=UPI00189E0696|nr:DpnD/PcfM family protein [Turicibacter sanguinis]